jgi:hypothetical protein
MATEKPNIHAARWRLLSVALAALPAAATTLMPATPKPHISPLPNAVAVVDDPIFQAISDHRATMDAIEASPGENVPAGLA